MKQVKKRIAAALTAAAIAVTGFLLPAFAENWEDVPEPDEIAVMEDIGTSDQMFTLPTDMRAAVITPSVDYYTDSAANSDALDSELDNIYSEFAEIGLNTVIINTVYEGTAFYSLGGEDGCDPVLFMSAECRPMSYSTSGTRFPTAAPARTLSTPLSQRHTALPSDTHAAASFSTITMSAAM